MKTRLFDGYQFAKKYQQHLESKLEALGQGGRPSIAAILFEEDAGSLLYTDLKKDTADELGIGYEVHAFSLLDPLSNIVRRISELNQNSQITGIIVQKPWRKTWIKARLSDQLTTKNSREKAGEEASQEAHKQAFQQWWRELVEAIDPQKDVDGLHPATAQAIQDGTWQEKGKVLPATARAVLHILEQAFSTSQEELFTQLKEKQIVIIGTSDLLGKPLQLLFTSKKIKSEMIGSQELKKRIEDKIWLKDADIVISSTGRRNLVTGDMLKEGAVVIDVGEPRGDVDRASVEGKAAFLTPVPGGVGPMTVVCLMENAIDMI